MEPILDFQVTVIGGDSRQITVASALTGLFKKVKIFGHPPAMLPNGLENCFDLTEAITDAKVILLPIGGMNDVGMIRSYQADPLIDFGKYLSKLPEDSIIFAGSFTDKWLQLAKSLKLKVFQYADDDEIAILNSIPTAEGTLQMAMEELPITIHGSTVIVIGFGRVGVTVARVFKAMGAQVFVSARRKSSLARATEMSCQTVPVESLSEVMKTADLVINTVPSLILDRLLIAKLPPQAVIIDLASPPGGTDFEAAKELNIKAILAPGLPGLVAPKTAGGILAATIPQLIVEYLQAGGDVS